MFNSGLMQFEIVNDTIVIKEPWNNPEWASENLEDELAKPLHGVHSWYKF